MSESAAHAITAPVKVAPSILSADQLDLGNQVRKAIDAGADLLHLDIMDGHFVPNLTFGPGLAGRLQQTGIPLDAHLMVSNPGWAIEAFARYAEYLTVHVEATPHLHRMLRLIREKGCKSGVALNPSTSPGFLKYVLEDVDLILIMTVNPGWGGQPFIPAMLQKIEEVSELVRHSGLPVEISVDGGISATNSRAVLDKGAGILVSGNYIFSSDDMASAIESLRRRTLVNC
ncbi:MAG TPA: ribulose-phosphate 3-epimerase [Firmicutes bacterium]|nr:ribulose-phosphate 3-epimerase [Candidatus Fermentithermobacillaceae bacterium]